MKFSLVRLRVRLCWSTQILFRHVLGLRTPLLRQGDVTDSFSSVHLCASCERFWTYVFRPTTRWDFSVGRHSVPVFVRTRENSLLPSWRSLLYVFAFALFSTCVTGRGLIEWTLLLIFDMTDFPSSTLRKRPRNEHDEVEAIVGNQRHHRKYKCAQSQKCRQEW